MSLFAFASIAVFLSPVDAARELIFVNAMWRHGNRAPDYSFPADKVKLSEWKEGGVGYGQLTTAGMKMHINLGKQLRARYIESTPALLSKHYLASEIYIRSTDYNRTLNSATANLLGMYSQKENENRKGVDYPDAAGWPPGFVPIPIHTMPYEGDRIGNPDADCKRQDELYRLLKNSSEYHSFWKSPSVEQVMRILSISAGVNTQEPDNLWKIVDTLFVEDIYYRDQVDKWYPWYPAIRTRLQKINDHVNNLYNGVGLNDPRMCGINTETELKKIRGGTLLKTVREYLRKKLDTIEKRTDDTYMQGLKYFALSAHDTTLSAYLNVLGITPSKLRLASYPKYAACILTELWKDTETKQAFVKVLFFGGDNNTISFEPITKHVAGCQEDFCPFAVYEKLAATFDPGNITALCNTPLAPANCAASPTSSRPPPPSAAASLSRTPPRARPPQPPQPTRFPLQSPPQPQHPQRPQQARLHQQSPVTRLPLQPRQVQHTQPSPQTVHPHQPQLTKLPQQPRLPSSQSPQLRPLSSHATPSQLPNGLLHPSSSSHAPLARQTPPQQHSQPTYTASPPITNRLTNTPTVSLVPKSSPVPLGATSSSSVPPGTTRKRPPALPTTNQPLPQPQRRRRLMKRRRLN